MVIAVDRSTRSEFPSSRRAMEQLEAGEIPKEEWVLGDEFTVTDEDGNQTRPYETAIILWKPTYRPIFDSIHGGNLFPPDVSLSTFKEVALDQEGQAALLHVISSVKGRAFRTHEEMERHVDAHAMTTLVREWNQTYCPVDYTHVQATRKAIDDVNPKLSLEERSATIERLRNSAMQSHERLRLSSHRMKQGLFCELCVVIPTVHRKSPRHMAAPLRKRQKLI